MKRSGFRKQSVEEIQTKQAAKRLKLASKPFNTLKRSPSTTKKKKTKNPSVRQIKDKLWNECKRIIRKLYEHTCYTCGKQGLTGSDLHTGHSKPKAALPLQFKFDIRGLRPQCMVCNVHHGGMSDIFIARLYKEEEGKQFIEECCYYDQDWNAWRIRQDIPSLGGRDASIFVQELLEKYRAI